MKMQNKPFGQNLNGYSTIHQKLKASKSGWLWDITPKPSINIATTGYPHQIGLETPNLTGFRGHSFVLFVRKMAALCFIMTQDLSIYHHGHLVRRNYMRIYIRPKKEKYTTPHMSMRRAKRHL